MQPNPQLQWKRAQAQSHLLSRKRKLAELWTVTVPNNLDDYNQKLQAFHDANDLERGRLFDETKLPPRSIVTRSQRKRHASQTPNDALPPSTTSPRHKSPAKIDSTLSTKTKGRSRGNTPRRTNPDSVIESRNESPTLAGDVVTAGKARSPEDEDLPDHATSAVPSSSHLTPPGSSSDKATSHSIDQETEAVIEAANLEAPVNQRPRSRSPLVLQPDQPPNDPQSSPASTNGPGSSNTPGPGAGSPNTSPDEELTIVPDNLGSERPGRRKGLELPRRPDTPDSTQEPQLQDESAMDLDSAVQPEAPKDGEMVSQQAESQPRSPKDVTSRKPSMRIDTQTNIGAFFKPASSITGVVESPGQMTGVAATPRRVPPPTSSGQDTAKRATRISSGVLQKKSVSEILGETPKHASMDSPLAGERDVQSSEPFRIADRERLEREKAKLSTVVFAKSQKVVDGDTIEAAGPSSAHDSSQAPERDYLYTLFENKAITTKGPSLTQLVQQSHKTLSTADHLIEYNLQTECRILKRLYQLQERNRWALRQPKRAEEAPRPTSHWDFLLDQAKWMRTDFREERKWKLVAARELASACAEWYHACQEERKALQVNVRPPTILDAPRQDEDAEMEDEVVLSSHPTPELVDSHEDDSIGGDIPDPRDVPGVAPAAIFSLGASDFNFATNKTPAFDKLLNELPLYEPTPIIPDMSKSNLGERMDARWRTDIVPVSRYATEKLHVKEYKPPIKKSRYNYDEETSPTRKTEPLPPRDTNVALFMAENKHIRDRIHPGHSFRPPSEHPMPSQQFFETRSSSHWLAAEDDELRRMVKEFSYNWSLISSVLAQRSMYSSGLDRRTPWECFERWIGLEGLPADMSKTPYFKTYSGRIEAAVRHVAQQAEEQQRRAGPNQQPLPRKRMTTQPMRVERKRAQRHLAMMDAMRKLAKKRESAAQKQAHQAELQALRRNTEVNQPKAPFQKPWQYANLRQERDAKRAEQQEIYRQQLIAHQRAAQVAQRGQNGQPNGMPTSAGGMRPPSNGMPGIPNGGLQLPNGQARPHPAMLAAMNGMQGPPPGMMSQQQFIKAQAQMQANMSRGMPPSPQQIHMLNEARKVQAQQLMQQQAQANGQHSSPIGSHVGLANGQGMSSATYAAGSPNGNGNGGTSSSPRSQNAGQLSSGLVPAITALQNKIREQNPSLTEDEIMRQASKTLSTYHARQATAAAAGQGPQRSMVHNPTSVQAAMAGMNSNAAAHAQNAAAMQGYGMGQQGMMTNEQVIAYQRQQQAARAQQQQAQVNASARGMQVPGQGMPQGMAMGMTNSPNMSMARPVSGHGLPQGMAQQGQGQGLQAPGGQMSRSVTPRDGRSGSIGQQGQGQAQGQNGNAPQGSPRPGSSRAMQGQQT